MPDIETFVLVQSCAPERVNVYIAKGIRSEVISKAQSLLQWFTITTLKAAASQTLNPWNGTLLEEVAFTHPTDAFIEAVRYASHHLRDLPEHQRASAIQRGHTILVEASKPKVIVDRTSDLPPIENLPLTQITSE
jgi:hypothetical protein